MAALEILALDEATPQIRAPGAGDTYQANRKLTIAPPANGNALAISGFSLTGANAQSLLDLAGTWNTTGTPSGIKLNVTDTASAASSALLDLQLGGSSKFNVRKDGFAIAGSLGVGAVSSGNLSVYLPSATVRVRSDGSFQWSSSATQAVTGADLVLARDAANTLALRNGASPQTFNLYNAYTDGSNHERGFARFNANVFEIGTAAAGTGTVRDLALVPGAGGSIRMGTHSTIAGETVTGYITVKDAGGTSRKLAVVS